MRRTLNSAIEKLKLKFETHMMKKVRRFSFDNFSNGILYVEALIVVYANFKIFFKSRNCNYIITLLCDMNYKALCDIFFKEFYILVQLLFSELY